MKKTITLCLLGIWGLLFSIYAVEVFGYFTDTQEYSGQSIEQILSAPVDVKPHISQQLSILKPLSEFPLKPISLVPLSHLPELGSESPLAYLSNIPPFESSPPLFQLFSNLRL